MRLIDADELKEWIAWWFGKNEYYHPYSESNNVLITDMYDLLDVIPTIDPVKHGQWIKMSDADGIFYGCSECGEWHKETSNYCPNCGAKMDKERKKMEIPKYFYFRVRTINKGTGVEMEDASDVDVVEVIRCKDCKHSRTSPISAKVWDPDDDFMACRFHGRMVVEDDFCSWGEKEE